MIETLISSYRKTLTKSLSSTSYSDVLLSVTDKAEGGADLLANLFQRDLEMETKGRVDPLSIYEGLLLTEVLSDLSLEIAEDTAKGHTLNYAKSSSLSEKVDASISSLKDDIKLFDLVSGTVGKQIFRLYLDQEKRSRGAKGGESSVENSSVTDVSGGADKARELLNAASKKIKDSLSSLKKNKVKVSLDEKKLINGLEFDLTSNTTKSKISKVSAKSSDGRDILLYDSSNKTAQSLNAKGLLGFKGTLTEELTVEVDGVFSNTTTLGSLSFLSIKTPSRISLEKKISTKKRILSVSLYEDTERMPAYMRKYFSFTHEIRTGSEAEWQKIMPRNYERSSSDPARILSKFSTSSAGDSQKLRGVDVKAIEYRGTFELKGSVPFEVLSSYFDDRAVEVVEHDSVSVVAAKKGFSLKKPSSSIESVLIRQEAKRAMKKEGRFSLGVNLSVTLLKLPKVALSSTLKIFSRDLELKRASSRIVDIDEYFLTQDGDVIVNDSSTSGHEIFCWIPAEKCNLRKGRSSFSLESELPIGSPDHGLEVDYFTLEDQSSFSIDSDEIGNLTGNIDYAVLRDNAIDNVSLAATQRDGTDITTALFKTKKSYADGHEVLVDGDYSIDYEGGKVYFYRQASPVSIFSTLSSLKRERVEKAKMTSSGKFLSIEGLPQTKVSEEFIPTGSLSHTLLLGASFSSHWSVIPSSIRIEGYDRLAESSLVTRVENLPIKMRTYTGGVSYFDLPLGPLDRNLNYSIKSLGSTPLGSEGFLGNFDWRIVDGRTIEVKQSAPVIQTIECSYFYIAPNLGDNLFFVDEASDTLFFKEAPTKTLTVSFEMHSYHLSNHLKESVKREHYLTKTLKQEVKVTGGAMFESESRIDGVEVEYKTIRIDNHPDVPGEEFLLLNPRYVEIEVETE